jgi:hypothetical protein
MARLFANPCFATASRRQWTENYTATDMLPRIIRRRARKMTGLASLPTPPRPQTSEALVHRRVDCGIAMAKFTQRVVIGSRASRFRVRHQARRCAQLRNDAAAFARLSSRAARIPRDSRLRLADEAFDLKPANREAYRLVSLLAPLAACLTELCSGHQGRADTTWVVSYPERSRSEGISQGVFLPFLPQPALSREGASPQIARRASTTRGRPARSKRGSPGTARPCRRNSVATASA